MDSLIIYTFALGVAVIWWLARPTFTDRIRKVAKREKVREETTEFVHHQIGQQFK